MVHSSKTSLRVLHCPTTVGGYNALAARERELGVDSWSVTFEQNQYAYLADEVLWPEGIGLFRREVRRWKLLWRAIRDFDVVHFNFGLTLTPQRIPFSGNGRRGTNLRWLADFYSGLVELRDLQLLKKAGKGIVVTFQGCDARQGSYCEKHFERGFLEELGSNYYTPVTDAHKRWRISRISRYADQIYALNPDLLWLLPRGACFLPYGHLDLRQWEEGPPKQEEDVVVVHAPTHRGMKGTRFVCDAVERLKAEGIRFDFQLVEGLSHAEAVERYRSADLLVDQLLAGWYGGLSLEFMALGKPVMCFIRERDLGFIPESMRQELPMINVTPARLYETLKEWLTTRRRQLSMQGRKCRSFVERWHDGQKIAAQVVAKYKAIINRHNRSCA